MSVKNLSPTVPRLLLKLLAPSLAGEYFLKQPAQESLYLHIARLEHILQQVRKEGFHVEYVHELGWQGMQISEITTAVKQWTRRTGIKVSINQERGIFFFEKP